MSPAAGAFAVCKKMLLILQMPVNQFKKKLKTIPVVVPCKNNWF
jgi:hypothetical protein